MALVSDPSDLAANSYIDEADADAYFVNRLNSDNWDSAETPQKEAALIYASLTLDIHYDWKGANKLEARTLRWPRTGITNLDDIEVDDATIPVFIENGTCELALALLGSDRLGDADTAGFSEISVASIKLKIDKMDRIPLIPGSANAFLSPYGTKIVKGDNAPGTGFLIRG